MTPAEIDTELARLYDELYAVKDRQARNATSLRRMAGAEFYYRGRQRVTDMTVAEALESLRPVLAAHADDKYGYTPLAHGGSVGQARDAVASHDELEAAEQDVYEAIQAAEATYTGWSRFFLVTSSAGHVHRSMSCSTCNPRTRYGWLPELSGKAEAEAVADLGPTLCTVCFPSAPVEWTEGKKLTKAQAAKRVGR